jgi:hypothetical protein
MYEAQLNSMSLKCLHSTSLSGSLVDWLWCSSDSYMKPNWTQCLHVSIQLALVGPLLTGYGAQVTHRYGLHLVGVNMWPSLYQIWVCSFLTNNYENLCPNSLCTSSRQGLFFLSPKKTLLWLLLHGLFSWLHCHHNHPQTCLSCIWWHAFYGHALHVNLKLDFCAPRLHNNLEVFISFYLLVLFPPFQSIKKFIVGRGVVIQGTQIWGLGVHRWAFKGCKGGAQGAKLAMHPKKIPSFRAHSL